MESSTIFYLHIKLAFSGSGPFSEDWGEADAWMRSGVGDVLVAALHLGFRETLDLSELLLRTLYCGETVVVHCIAGRHRAGGASAVLSAALMDESFEVSSSWISARRNTDILGFCKGQSGRPMVSGNSGGHQRRDRWPKPTGYLATSRSSLHIQGFQGIPLCQRHQKTDKANRLQEPLFTEDWAEAEAWMRPWCRGCLGRCPASWMPRDAGSE